MRSTGAELLVVVMKVLQWHWSEGTTLSGFTGWSNAMREEPLGKVKPFDIPKSIVWAAHQRIKANRRSQDR
jgi:hypothetical protein